MSEIYYRIVNEDHPVYNTSWNPINGDWSKLSGEVFHQGTSQVWFYLIDNSGNGDSSQAQVMFTVEVLDMPNPNNISGN